MEGQETATTTEAVETQAAPEAAQETQTAPPAERTYTSQEMSDTVSKRVNEVNSKWKDFGDPDSLRQRLAKAEQMERFVEQMRAQQAQAFQQRQQQQPEALTDEDKKVQAYMERLYPGFSKQLGAMKEFGAQMQQLDGFRWSVMTDRSHQFLDGIAKKAGYGDGHLEALREDVANSIRGNQQDWQKYVQTGDLDVVKRHFEAVDKRIKGYTPQTPPAVNPQAIDQARTAAAAKKLPPKMPPAGVPAPTSKTQKMSDAERIGTAHEALKKALGGG